MSYTIPDIIQWGKICQPLARRAQKQQQLSQQGTLADDLDIKLYLTRKDVEYAYAQDPNSANTFQQANYLLSLEAPYLFAAQQITGGGGSITPVIPSTGILFKYLIDVNGGVPDFSNATDYNDPAIVGHNLDLFLNDINRFLVSGEWFYTPTGIRIFLNDGMGGNSFNATVNNYTLKIFIKDPFGTSGGGTEVTRSFQYTGIGGETSFFQSLLEDSNIISVARGTDYQLIYSGTPTGLEALITLDGALSDGHITFANDNPILPNEIVTVIFSKSVGGVPPSPSGTFIIV